MQRMLSRRFRALELIYELEEGELEGEVEHIPLSSFTIIAIALGGFLVGLCVLAGLWRAFRDNEPRRSCSIFKPLRSQEGASIGTSAYRQTIRFRLLKPSPTTIWGVGFRDLGDQSGPDSGLVEVISLHEEGVARQHMRVGDLLLTIDGKEPTDAYDATVCLNTQHGAATATEGPMVRVSRAVAGIAPVQNSEGIWTR